MKDIVPIPWAIAAMTLDQLEKDMRHLEYTKREPLPPGVTFCEECWQAEVDEVQEIITAIETAMSSEES